MVIERLSEDYSIRTCFYNPNIHPTSEYEKREEEMRELAVKMGVTTVQCEYDSERWFELTRGHEHEPEKGRRCALCFEMRLRRVAEMANELNVDAFGTVLTVSPHKDAATINCIGESLAREFGVDFLSADFKKKDGFKRSIELSAAFGLYRQNYCGCCYSKRDRETRFKKGEAQGNTRIGEEL